MAVSESCNCHWHSPDSIDGGNSSGSPENGRSFDAAGVAITPGSDNQQGLASVEYSKFAMLLHNSISANCK